MRKSTVTLALASLAFASSFAQNPIIQTKYTSDPAPYVHGDTLYLLTDHDNGVRDGYDMTEWLLYTTTDMVNWTDHGPIASLADYGRWASTADNGAWASQLVERNGRWYMYNAIQLCGVGVLRADSPYSPWKDPRKRALYNFDTRDIDPTVFIDDGKAYIYWGNNGLWYAKLSESMTQLSPVRRYEIPLTEETVGGYKLKDSKGEDSVVVGSDCYEEAPWVYKRGGKYYLVYAGGPIPEHLSYAMADTITGPWHYKGRLQDTPEGSFTTHPGIVDYKGHSYFFTHSGQLKGGNGFHRSVCAMEFHYNDDGTIAPFAFDNDGVTEPVGHLDALSRQEAETIAWSSGVTTRKDSADVPTASNKVYVCGIDNNDYTRVRSIDFGSEGATEVAVCVRTDKNEGYIEVTADGNSEVLATISVPAPTLDWTVLSATLSQKLTGIHDVQFKFKATGRTSTSRKNLFFFDYWQFATGTTGISTISSGRRAAGGKVYTIDGRLAGNSLKGLPKGLYIADGRKVVVR